MFSDNWLASIIIIVYIAKITYFSQLEELQDMFLSIYL